MASPPQPKRPRVDSSGPTKANFLYFGLSFIWEELFLKEPCNRILLDDLPSPLIVAAIKEDLKRFRTGGFPKIASSSSRNTSFKRVEKTNIWLFQHANHVACSAVLFEHFHGALANNTAHTECDSYICLQTQDAYHLMLEPYLHDNVSLKRVYTSLAEAGQLSEQGREVVGQLLGRLGRLLQNPFAEPSAVPEEFSTGGAPLNVRGYMFNEDVWSLRLSGCLKLFLPQCFDVKMTGKLGLEFATNQMLYTGVPVSLCQCYPFHGTPDITINTFPIVVDPDTETGVGGGETESGSEPDSVIENAQQAPRQVEYPPKLGELLANMHIRLVKKILRGFVQKKKHEEVKLVSRGLLLHKAAGGIMCEMSVELKKKEPAQLDMC